MNVDVRHLQNVKKSHNADEDLVKSGPGDCGKRPEFKDYHGNNLPPKSIISKSGGMHSVFD